MDSSNLRTLQKKRTTNFREDETKLLIQLWGSPQIQNKLYLTHRKAPVMRLLAANMQKHGFYRTPDEIKTRIRNLKCLYHRIKRTMQSGAGIGTVDPDWPHFKAMDDILSKESNNKDEAIREQLFKDNGLFEGPKCEEIKQEIEDIEINDDMESFTSNSIGSDYGDDNPLPILTPAPAEPKEAQPKQIAPKIAITKAQQPVSLPTILPNFAIPIQQQNMQNGRQGLPFPLLIVQSNQQKPHNPTAQAIEPPKVGLSVKPESFLTGQNSALEATLLKDLLEVQRENLNIERQRLQLEKEKMDFEKFLGTQLITLIPIFGNMLQKLSSNSAEEKEDSPKRFGKKRSASNDLDILKDSKILRNVLEQGIKKYMMGNESNEEESSDDNNDSGCSDGKEEDNIKRTDNV